MKSLSNGKRVGVTMYNSAGSAALTYCGSACWLFLLLVLDSLMIGSSVGMWSDNGYDATVPFFSIALASNVIAFTLQTTDAVFFDHTMWPLQAAKWSLELFNIAILSAITGYAFTIHDEHRNGRISANATLLYFQILFTASSFSLTLEYLYRAVTVSH